MDAAITGMGCVCALGRGVDALWAGIEAGRDGIRPIGRFDAPGVKTKIAGMIPDRNSAADAETPITDLNLEFALDAAREAGSMAGLEASGIAPRRLALILGTSLGDFRRPLHEIAETLAERLGIAGPALTVSTACSSSTNALGLGMDLLRQGFADAVLAGGTDALSPTMLAGFHSLGVLSEGKCAPFSAPFGTTLGEGAGFLVLERAEAARERGAEVLGRLAGYGLSGDAFHETSPDPTGSGVARSIAGALRHGGLDPERIGYVNAHGTGTSANDPAEWRAIQAALGPHALRIPVSSTKSYLGHAQGACGVLELMVTVLAMRRGVAPPTLHSNGARKQAPADPVFAPAPRPHRSEYSVCTNSAFGGANAAVVVGLGGPLRASAPRPPRTVYVTGAGAVGPHGWDGAALLPALLAGRRAGNGRVPDFSPSELLPNLDPRGLDPSSRFLAAAARLALADAGLAPKKARNDRIGLIMGIDFPSPESSRALDRSIRRNGLALLSTSAFSRMVLNAPAGTCSKLLALGGPLSTISIGSGCGLAALAYAADWLSARDDADHLVAGGLDEVDLEAAPPDAAEGAACAVLSAAPGPGPAIALSGWGWAGPGGAREAVRSACASASMEEGAVGAVFGSGLEGLLPGRPILDPEAAFGRAPAFASALAFIAAVLWLREGRGHAALVADARGRSATGAIILSRKGNGNG